MLLVGGGGVARAVLPALYFRSAPTVDAAARSSHARGFAFRGACVATAPAASDKGGRRSIRSGSGSSGSQAAGFAGFGALGAVGPCPWLRTCGEREARYVTRLGPDASVRVDLAANATRPATALPRGASGGRVVGVLLAWAQASAAAGGAGGDRSRPALPAVASREL